MRAAASVREINRAVTDLGMVAGMFPTYFRYTSRSAGDPYFDPIYAECERLGVPVAFHATGAERGECRFDSFLGLHLFSHVPEQMIVMTQEVFAQNESCWFTARHFAKDGTRLIGRREDRRSG